MSTDSAIVPVDGDVIEVERRLAALWTELTPAQQAVLDALIAAGLAVTSPNDTGGFSLTMSPPELDAFRTARTEALQRDWQRANTKADAAAPPRRWDLRPLLEWFRRAPAAAPQPRTEGGSPNPA